MGSFVRKVIGGDERIVLLTRLHWIYLVIGLFWFLFFCLVGNAIDYFLWHWQGATSPLSSIPLLGYHIAFLILLAVGTFVFMVHALKVLSTEIAVTDGRLIYKTGLFFVEVEEIDLVEIRAEHIHHGWLGRFLGYGRIQLDSRFVGDIHLPAVRKPYRLIRVIHKVRHKLYDPMADRNSRLVESDAAA